MQEVQMTTPIGTQLQGRYVIEDLLGQGGFSAVYIVKDRKLGGKRFAIKELKNQSRSERERFLFECEILKRLQHPALPMVSHLFEDNNQTYMLMEYIDGFNIEKLRKQQVEERFTLSEVLALLAPVVDAISYLHRQPIPVLHRDIKPANIMITDKGDIYLIDFGTARRYRADQSRDTGSLGSPGYAAPEQYGKAQTTPKTDLYGLGATLQTLLTGKEPLEIATGGIPPECDIPSDLQRLIRHMMKRDASKRPHDMLVIGEALADTKKRLSGLPGRFASPFTWLATVWVIFMIEMARTFLSTFSLDIWSFYFLIALCAAIGISIHHFYKTKRIIRDKLTIKEIGSIINEGLSRPLVGMCWILIVGCFYSLIPLLFRLHGMQLVTLIGFVIIGLSVIFAILKGLPWLLKWLKRKRATKQAQQSTSIPPLQQQMH